VRLWGLDVAVSVEQAHAGHSPWKNLAARAFSGSEPQLYSMGYRAYRKTRHDVCTLLLEG
jgi:hypothetical protein